MTTIDFIYICFIFYIFYIFNKIGTKSEVERQVNSIENYDGVIKWQAHQTEEWKKLIKEIECK